MRPRIGITCANGGDQGGRFSLAALYVDAVVSAGGLPLLLPCNLEFNTAEVGGVIDGLLLPGGGDVDPVYFGEEPLLANGRIDPVADRFELALCRSFLEGRRPVLGICRGVQVLNIAAGGDIYQDVVDQTGSRLQHVQKAPRWHPTHTIQVRVGTFLESIVQRSEFRVNSFHHQGIRTVPSGFVIAATAPDGLVEAVERPGDPFTLGVQWHPERRFDRSVTDRAVFEAFVNACRD